MRNIPTYILLMSILITTLFSLSSHAAPGNPNTGEVPEYILKGLAQYKKHGYAAAVKTWLKGSPYEAGTQMASQIAFFKNIEMLYGKYVSYDIISVIQTGTSNRVYVRMNFERTSGYILFTSIKKNGRWVLAHIDLDRVQKYAKAHMRVQLLNT